MDEIRLDPDPVWTERFEHERNRVRDAASDGEFGVFHDGSTAVPDFPTKPLLDVLAVFGGTSPRGRPWTPSRRRGTTFGRTSRSGSN